MPVGEHLQAFSEDDEEALNAPELPRKNKDN